MRFQKINENVIRCTITQEEMRCQGINLDDLMDNRAKAEEFLQYILTKARHEIDFVTSGDVLNVQLSVMKDGEVSLMISDDQNAAIRALAQQFKDKLREFSKALEGGGAIAANAEPKAMPEEHRQAPPEEEQPATDFWARLATMDDCIRMSKALSASFDVPATLYKYYGEYYIRVHIDLPQAVVAKALFTMSEYADEVSPQSNEFLMVSEHGDVLIREDAVAQLGSL